MTVRQTTLTPLPARTVFGIDPGSRKCGWAVVRTEGRRVLRVASGLLQPSLKTSLHFRLWFMADRLRTLLATHRPPVVAVEDQFVPRKLDTVRGALVAAQARGACVSAVGGLDLPLRVLTPAEIKQAVAGKGNASKAEVQRAVRMLLGYEAQEDEADALAIAMTAATRGRR